MKHNLIRLFVLATMALGAFSCKKDYGDKIGPLQDSLAPIPVTVKNAAYFERIPVVTSSVANGAVNITLQIPADKGQIKQITRVATGTTLANLQADQSYALNYSTTTRALTPILGNGTNEITFTSTLAAYSAYRTRIASNAGYSAGLNSAGAAPTVTTIGTPPVVDERNPNFIRYWFVVTLEDNTELVTTEVRVRIIP